MTSLLIGFDSAWTRKKSGAIIGTLRLDNGTFAEISAPLCADYIKGEEIIQKWQAETNATTTIVMLDQPIIVKNARGQRPVENIVSSPVSLRYGGVQPANTSKKEMFGTDAPLWPFLAKFGGAADPLIPVVNTRVFETYPVLIMIALDWILPDARATGRIPKYNPVRKGTFSIADWEHVCTQALTAYQGRSDRGLNSITAWIERAVQSPTPRKSEQDCLDACVCLLMAIHLSEQKDCMMVGNQQTGYIIVPYSASLFAEMKARCETTDRVPLSKWVRAFHLGV